MDSGGGATAIRVPYRHLRDAEMELVSLNNSSGSSSSSRASPSPKDHQPHSEEDGDESRTGGGAPKYRVVLACMVAAGVQFGWALQLSLLTPYIQVPTTSRHAPLTLPAWLAG
jgi:solute carrier family 45 protein 1/2/4